MGFWKTLGKIGLGVAGVAGAPFTGGASLALPAIAAGGHIAGAVIGSKAAKGAAKTQATAANLAGQRQERANQDALRYIEARRLGLPDSPYGAGGSLSSTSQMAPGGPIGMQGGTAAYQPFSIGQTPPGGQMVMLEGPDGSRKAVPAQMAQRYISRGAKVLS